MGKRKDGLDDRVTLIQAMLAVAHADGDFSEVERRRTEQLMDFLRLGGASRDYVQGLLDADGPPTLPERDELPKYEVRLYIFQHALIMAFEDGVIEEGEEVHLQRLAELMELKSEDVERGWRRAREMSER